MDSEVSSFQSGLAVQALGASPLASVPSRIPTTMPAGALVAWTPSRMLSAMGAWLMEETQLPATLVATPKRRA